MLKIFVSLSDERPICVLAMNPFLKGATVFTLSIGTPELPTVLVL